MSAWSARSSSSATPAKVIAMPNRIGRSGAIRSATQPAGTRASRTHDAVGGEEEPDVRAGRFGTLRQVGDDHAPVSGEEQDDHAAAATHEPRQARLSRRRRAGLRPSESAARAECNGRITVITMADEDQRRPTRRRRSARTRRGRSSESGGMTTASGCATGRRWRARTRAGQCRRARHHRQRRRQDEADADALQHARCNERRRRPGRIDSRREEEKRRPRDTRRRRSAKRRTPPQPVDQRAAGEDRGRNLDERPRCRRSRRSPRQAGRRAPGPAGSTP